MENQDKNSTNKPETSLFRKEVLQRKKGTFLGKTVIVTPLSFSFAALGILCIAVILGMFLYFGKYTKRHIVHGIIIPNKGVISIYSDNPGIVINRFVEQGNIVKKGDLLYQISTEQHNLTQETHLMQQVESLQKQIEMQKLRIALLEENLKNYQKLRDKHVTSETEYQKHKDAFLAAKLSLHDLEYRLSEVKGKSNYAIRAPSDGIVSVLTTMIGDQVPARSLLASIIPVDSQMQGMLYVPSDAIGFVKIGQKVLLRYQAYPYQQFGLYEAKVERIDNSILAPGDIKIPINMNVPFYRVIVNLKQQTVSVYGKSQPVIPGLLFEGIIFSEERRLWQWILSPIYSLRGNLI